MTEEISIKSSGLTLASLMSECEQADFDKIGFLLGYYSEEIIKSVTDAEIETIKIKKMLNITGIFPISDVFYNHIGEVNHKNKNIEYIRNEKNVIGWYRSRKHTNLKMTVREKLIHKELCSISDKPDMFTFCALTSSYTKNSATHTYSQIFYRYDYTQFIEIPLIITNLGDADKLYKTTSQKTGTIDKIIRNIRSDVNVNSDLCLNKIENSVQQHIYSLINQVSKLYEEKKHLELEIQRFNEQETHESDDSSPLKEIFTKTSEELKDKLNYANVLKNNSPIVNKETKKALNAQLKMVPDSPNTKEKSSKARNSLPSPSTHITLRNRSSRANRSLLNNSKELNTSGLLQEKDE
ncbi:BRCA1-A complex subunit Abraxas 1-like [Chrysoperla carnea]|uniref:BRCA1-A complex subunit Abraxas 1-like n=1 Tax=Chrysoperla carnea TaxID=189513 RepID=UPI001D072B3C|nr:BRCA1-A complex subunit Abraxas 1-like [Chrysoperla carnea]